MTIALIQENLRLRVQPIINTRGGGVEKCRVIGNSILPIYHGCVREGHRHIFKVAVTLQANTHTHTCTVCSYSFMCLPQYGTVMHVTLVDRGQTNSCHPVIVNRCVSQQLWCQRTPSWTPSCFFLELSVASLKPAMQKRLWTPNNTA